jgi:ubiquinone/menaquinone biosynthesis C-methylase UbiE
LRMSFDLLAPHYRWLEFVLAGEKLQRCRTAFLNQAREPSRILILGEGNGRFLVECRRQFRDACITCVDASHKMLGAAGRRLVSHGFTGDRTEFICADALNWCPPPQGFDVIATHFFLDCFRPEQLERLVRKLSQVATPKANWWLSDFQIPATGFARFRAEWVHRLMYLFFRVVTRLPAQHLTPPDPFLRANGFVLQQRRVTEWGLLRADCWRREPVTAS